MKATCNTYFQFQLGAEIIKLDSHKKVFCISKQIRHGFGIRTLRAYGYSHIKSITCGPTTSENESVPSSFNRRRSKKPAVLEGKTGVTMNTVTLFCTYLFMWKCVGMSGPPFRKVTDVFGQTVTYSDIEKIWRSGSPNLFDHPKSTC